MSRPGKHDPAERPQPDPDRIEIHELPRNKPIAPRLIQLNMDEDRQSAPEHQPQWNACISSTFTPP